MKLAIVTAGAVGAFFGARFAQQGAEINFVARGAHLQALREKGLTIKTRDAEYHTSPEAYRVTEDAAEAVRGADLVLFAVKSFDTAEVARALAPGLATTTTVLSLQNGVSNEAELAGIIGEARTAGGIAYVFAGLEAPGIVSVPSNAGRLALADKTLAGAALPHLEDFRQLCLAAQVPCEITADIWKLKWTKLVFNSALNGWTTLLSTTLDHLLKDPETRPAFVATLQETVAVAEASGVKLDNDVVEKTVALAGSLGPVYSSMYGDRQMGKRLEVDALNGFVVRKGRELGVPTPYNEKLYNELSALNK